ncbi:hypothetical protein Tco_0741170 [Tanacetum coccineum]
MPPPFYRLPLHIVVAENEVVIGNRRWKRGRHRESPPLRSLSETSATISTVVPKRYSHRRPNLFMFVLENTAVAIVQESVE